MEIITITAFLAVAVITGITTFLATKSAYNDEHAKTRAEINNQLIINEEKDKSHEFSQTVFIVLLAIITIFIALYITINCAVKSICNKYPQRQNVPKAQIPAVAEEFNA